MSYFQLWMPLGGNVFFLWPPDVICHVTLQHGSDVLLRHIFLCLVLWVTKDTSVSGSGDVCNFCICVSLCPSRLPWIGPPYLCQMPTDCFSLMTSSWWCYCVNLLWRCFCVSESFYFGSKLNRHVFFLFPVPSIFLFCGLYVTLILLDI